MKKGLVQLITIIMLPNTVFFVKQHLIEPILNEA